MKSLVSALLAGLLLPGLVSAVVRPNVLFVTIDDRNDWIGCMTGHPQEMAPSICRLVPRSLSPCAKK